MVRFDVVVRDGSSYVTISQGFERTVMATGIALADFKKYPKINNEYSYSEYVYKVLGGFTDLLRALNEVDKFDERSLNNAVGAFAPFVTMKKGWAEIEKFAEGE
ncbi:hypothetical protein P4V86_03245 [Brevibacillus laterosporus]|uniref:hypothetical protein n=1 Tax=Brevibacillus laterosporus TaxID=1465 RepID=UPI0003686CE9|nr:hypothetical protein [Brevibacillus laterosporus]ATO48539.1 hypothetical protein BrL25_05080 [Brevibacillus laterosporus DSM 25]MED2002373.1 hypothetical protein [Brevibacillus laterosporus]